MKKNPLLDVAFSKKIWKVCLSHSALLLELRDVSFSPASYTAIDLKEKKILWQNQSFFSSPRIFLCDVKMNKAIFSSFAEENLPRTQGVIVMDINTTAINWQNELLCYLKGYDSHILVYALHDIHKKVFACELQTGTIVENSQSLAKTESLILSPKRYFPETNSYNIINAFLKNRYQTIHPSFINYVETKTLVAISFPEKDHKTQVWWLLDRQSGERLYETCAKALNFTVVDDYLLLLLDSTRFLVFDI